MFLDVFKEILVYVLEFCCFSSVPELFHATVYDLDFIIWIWRQLMAGFWPVSTKNLVHGAANYDPSTGRMYRGEV
jgi:hypothetical protein